MSLKREEQNDCARDSKKNIRSRRIHSLQFLIVSIIAIQNFLTATLAQSIGYHPNLFLGFNPYLSPVHGYGLGLPYGTFGFGSLKNPWISGSLLGANPYAIENSFLGKVHAKSFLKKFSPHQYGFSPYYASLKSKLALSKHPEYLFSPYGLDYGFGKHYGSAMVPNNPYKSAYGEYYNQIPNVNHPPVSSQFNQIHSEPNQFIAQSSHKTHSILKPLVKVGALLTTAAILGKKTFETPLVRLNPSGMIMNGKHIIQ